MSGKASYIIRGGSEGRARLRVLTAAMAPHTNALLRDAGLSAGARVLDVGCGGGDVTCVMAERVGAAGSVVGLDLDAAGLSLARDEASARGLSNIEFVEGDIHSAKLEAGFDLVYARFLLSHLADPAVVTAGMRDLLRPGGMLVTEDVDFAGHFCYPPLPAFDDYVRWYQQAAQIRGADARLGLRLPELLCAAGLEEVDARAVSPSGTRGPAKQMAALTLAAIAENVIAAGIASHEEVAAALAVLEAAAQDDTTLMSLPRVVQCWGRNPL